MPSWARRVTQTPFAREHSGELKGLRGTKGHWPCLQTGSRALADTARAAILGKNKFKIFTGKRYIFKLYYMNSHFHITMTAK